MSDKVLLALPYESLITALSEQLVDIGRNVEAIPYLRGVIPTLMEKAEDWEALIITEKIYGSSADSTDSLMEMLTMLEAIRSEKRLSHLNIVVLTDLPHRHPFLRQLVLLGIYNLLNGSGISVSEVIKRLIEPKAYADVQHFLNSDLSIPWVGIAQKKPLKAKPITIERKVIEEKTIEVKQREIAVMSFYSAGASFLSINLAASLERRGKRIDLWDADIRDPALYYYFAMDSKLEVDQFGTNHLCMNDDGFNKVVIQKGALTVHTRPPADIPREPNLDDYMQFYDAARFRSDHRIIDISGGYLHPISQFILKQASDIVIVMDPNMVKWLQLYNNISECLQMINKEKCHWVLTRYDSSFKTGLQDLERLFDIEVTMTLPDATKEQCSAFTQGIPMIQTIDRLHPFSVQLDQFSDRLFQSKLDERWYNRIFKVFDFAR
jgi:MinD-like ATPase involved in chromosome partitioning or flagellar assembly